MRPRRNLQRINPLSTWSGQVVLMRDSRPRRGRRPARLLRANRRLGPGLRFAALVAGAATAAFATAYSWPLDEMNRLVPKLEKMLSHRDAPAPADRFLCEVAYVNDGDTLRCKDGTRVRLHAVAAREADETCSPGHPCPAATAASATAELRRLVADQTISCEQVGQSYNRITAICWTPAQVEINCAMIRSGTTMVWETFDRQRRLCRS
jgi:endonuclease YncB( thermonuclease family)